MDTCEHCVCVCLGLLYTRICDAKSKLSHSHLMNKKTFLIGCQVKMDVDNTMVPMAGRWSL